MAKSSRQKLKILYLMKAFLERTDEKHTMTIRDLITYLDSFGVSAERKAIYDDIECLRIFGMDIVSRREKPSGFYLASREFELAELKILVDAVQSSRFITSRKSLQLIHKLENLTSIYDAQKLQRQVFVENRLKTVNENVYYSVDMIHDAISDNHQISFQYYEWTVSREMRLRRNGERYHVSPWELIWKDENYYLVGLDEKSGIVKHYRVDKMLRLDVEKKSRNGSEIFQNFDASAFAARTFGMFGGREEMLRMDFDNSLVGVVIDRFGQDIMLHRKDAEHFTVFVRVNVSSQFFGWLAGLGTGAEVITPEKVREEYREFLQNALENYRQQPGRNGVNECKIKSSGVI